MGHENNRHLLRDFGANDVPAADTIQEYANRFSPEHVAFMRRANGGEGRVGNGYLCLWRAEDIAQYNIDYNTKAYLPGATLFGSDGGATAYGVAQDGGVLQYLAVPFGDLCRESTEVVSPSFAGLLKNIANA